MSDDRADISKTCWMLEGDACPRCGSEMATNGRVDWCLNDEVCGYCRKSTDAPLDSVADYDGSGLA